MTLPALFSRKVPMLTTLAVARLTRLRGLIDWAYRFVPPPRERRVRVLDTLMLGPTNRLAVVAFGNRELLLSVTKASVVLIAEQEA